MLDFTNIDKRIEAYLPDMERDLKTLVDFPSVEGEAAGEGAPFGLPVKEALDAALTISEKLGLSTCNMEGYCGYADLKGETDDMVGILGHLDVVPANAADWKFPPYDMTIEDGRIYGRGTMDDKGPMLAAMYGARALMDAGVKLSKTVRFIFGCNEETGMRCMKYYLAHAEAPKAGFTPDAEWPLIVGEKGIMHYTLTAEWDKADCGARLVRLDAGIAANVVPAKAEAVLCGVDTLPEAEGICVSREGERAVITATGAAAHASTPDEGENAISKLLRYLSGISFGPAGAKCYVDTLAALTGDDKYGADFGIAGEDDLSRTTNAPTVCHITEEGGTLTCDLRFLLTMHSNWYLASLTKVAGENGLTFTPGMYQEPLYLGSDSPLAKQLLQSYRDVTGDLSDPLVIGGGTYAKVMPGFLAFGPEPLGQPTRAHQANEYYTEKELLDSAKIYARAIFRMAE